MARVLLRILWILNVHMFREGVLPLANGIVNDVSVGFLTGYSAKQTSHSV